MMRQDETGEREGVDGALARTLTQPSAATDLTEGREGCDKGGQDTQKLSERRRNVMRNIRRSAEFVGPLIASLADRQ